MKKLIFTIIVVVFFSLSQIKAQSDIELKPINRSTSIFLSIGSLQILCVGTSYQINEKYSVGLVSSLYGLAGSYYAPNATFGLGFRGTYYFSPDGKGKFLRANNISADIEYLFPVGLGVECIVGRDCIIGKGLGFNWGFGLSMSTNNDADVLVAPAFKLGFHIDL